MFKEFPASKRSIAQRKLCFGVGTNDADYIVRVKIDGKRSTCPFYKRWNHMLERCYSEKFINRNPSYAGCTISDEWLTFSKFKNWMINQYWHGKQLDKDLKYTGNKHYSSETCIFVPQYINSLLTDRGAARGSDPQGVHFNKRDNKFQANCSENGRKKFLGYFNNRDDASKAYKVFKSALILKMASMQAEPLRGYLVRISKEILAQ